MLVHLFCTYAELADKIKKHDIYVMRSLFVKQHIEHTMKDQNRTRIWGVKMSHRCFKKFMICIMLREAQKTYFGVKKQRKDTSLLFLLACECERLHQVDS